MKARIKETGEIVVVEDLFDDGTALVNGCYIKVSKLSFIDYIDYEQRRYEIAKAILSGWATDGDGYMNAVNCNTCSLEIVRPYCKRAVEVADMLIAEIFNPIEKSDFPISGKPLEPIEDTKDWHKATVEELIEFFKDK